jgi:hypothetical protein
MDDGTRVKIEHCAKPVRVYLGGTRYPGNQPTTRLPDCGNGAIAALRHSGAPHSRNLGGRY